MDPRLQRRLTQEPVLLDLPREPIDEVVFDSYTDTGTLVKKTSCFQSYVFVFFCSFQSLPIYLLVSFSTLPGLSSPVLGFRSYSLKPGSRYMLEVTASEFYNNIWQFLPWGKQGRCSFSLPSSVVEFLHQSKSIEARFSTFDCSLLPLEHRDSLLGRAQLFFKTSPAPRGIMCQVQPVVGLELYTHFSIFCTSGREVSPYCSHSNQVINLIQNARNMHNHTMLLIP